MNSRTNIKAHIPTRRCSRCLEKLNDSTSLEYGIGPNCRELTNTLYGRNATANLPLAVALLLGVDTQELYSEIQEHFSWARTRILKISERVAQTGTTFDPTKKGFDLREVLETFDWILSFPIKETYRGLISKIVFHLGYTGLSAVLLQQASTGDAKVWFENGKLCLLGSSCKHGDNAFKQIKEYAGPKRWGDKNTPYTLPARMFEAFKIVVLTYWPNYTGDLQELQIIARAYKEAECRMSGMLPAVITADGKLVQPTGTITAEDLLKLSENNMLSSAAPPQTPSGSMAANTIVVSENPSGYKPWAYIKIRSEDFLLSMPFIRSQGAKMYSIVSEIKTHIPKKDRIYDSEAKTWAIPLIYRKLVLSLITDVYRVEELIITEPTPSKKSSIPPPPISGRYSYFSPEEITSERKTRRVS